MKLTKSQLRRIIKEELGALNEQGGGEVYLIVEPSVTYGGEGTEVRVIGAFLNMEEAQATAASAGASVLAVPLGGELDMAGYHP